MVGAGGEGVKAQFLRHKPTVFPLLSASWELEPLSISSKLCLHIFYSALGRESRDLGQ